MNPHEQLIEEFYAAFAQGDPEAMASCYHPEITFRDPAFGTLHGKDTADMWRMLLERSKGNLKVEFSDITADMGKGSAKWIARYPFSKTNRNVTNKVSAEFTFKDGLIFTHYDTFDFASWARQALGFTGWLFGNTNFLKNKVRKQALTSLKNWQNKQQK